MPSDITDLRRTIVPKSDQLNAEQLLSGPLTITVQDVSIGSTDEQPISIHHATDPNRPYKPCKTMRKVLIFAWGENGHDWIGRSMTLYNDPAVKFGGMDVGGIRISHLTDIERDIRVSLTATKGKKALHEIKVMQPPVDDKARLIELISELEGIAKKQGVDALGARWKKLTTAEQNALGIKERDRLKSIAAQQPPTTKEEA